MLVYLGCSAILAFVLAVAAALGGVPPAPTFHVFFAAGAMPLVFGAIVHFVPVLTRTGMPAAPIRRLPLAVQAAGIVVPPGLAGLLPGWSLHAAATAVALVALVLIAWISRCLRAALGAPHPGARWYGAALLCLFFAVSLVPVWLVLPELRPMLRLFHLHANTLGFIGLAALGTLPVLVPTAMKRPEPHAGARLLRDLPLAIGGVLLVAAGATGAVWLAWCGVPPLLWVAGRNLRAWRQAYGASAVLQDGAAAALAAATAGYVLLLLLGMAHGVGWLPARPAIAGFVALFLLPLVSGALSQLLPVWRHPGMDSPRRRALRERLVCGGRGRSLLFLGGGLLLVFGHDAGLLCLAAGLVHFALTLARAFWLDRPPASDDNRGLPQ